MTGVLSMLELVICWRLVSSSFVQDHCEYPSFSHSVAPSGSLGPVVFSARDKAKGEEEKTPLYFEQHTSRWGWKLLRKVTIKIIEKKQIAPYEVIVIKWHKKFRINFGFVIIQDWEEMLREFQHGYSRWKKSKILDGIISELSISAFCISSPRLDPNPLLQDSPLISPQEPEIVKLFRPRDKTRISFVESIVHSFFWPQACVLFLSAYSLLR